MALSKDSIRQLGKMDKKFSTHKDRTAIAGASGLNVLTVASYLKVSADLPQTYENKKQYIADAILAQSDKLVSVSA